MSSFDYLDLCRLCLVKDQVSVPIFEGDGDARQIFHKISFCLPVKVDREDKLPKKICDDCAYKVELCYQFYNTTANAEKQLLQWLGEVGLEDKQDYEQEVMNSDMMKQEPDNRINVTVLSSEEQSNNMEINMIDGMSLSLPIIMTNQQMPAVSMSSTDNLQNIQSVAGTSVQTTRRMQKDGGHEEIEDTEEDDNSEDECDVDEGMQVVKEESENSTSGSRSMEPTTFVNVALSCNEAGPSGLQQQKLGEISEMGIQQSSEGDTKTGCQGFQRINPKGKKSKDPHKCVKCDAYFFHMTKLVEHLKNTHGIENAFNCDECGKSFKSPMNIARHKLIHSGLKKFSCDVCEYSCHQKANLETHKRRHAQDYAFKCGVCKKGFVSKADFLEHEILHTNVKFRCEICNKNYSYKRNLDAHLRLCHYELRKMNKTSQYNCTECKVAFATLRTLKNHQRNRHRVKKRQEYLCDLCGAKVSSKKALDIHTRTHTGERNVSCDLCPKKFTTKENLKIHRRTHTGEKPYVCNECGKEFAQRSPLVIHLRYHNGETPYWCPECGRGFVTNNFLQKHRKNHDISKIVVPRFKYEQPLHS